MKTNPWNDILAHDHGRDKFPAVFHRLLAAMRGNIYFYTFIVPFLRSRTENEFPLSRKRRKNNRRETTVYI